MTEPTQRFNTTPRMTWTTRSLLLAAAATAMMVSGCSKSNDAKDAVSEASLEFSKISVGDPTLSSTIASTSYTNAGNATSEYAGNEKPFGEAAAVSFALSKLGMATLATGESTDAETEAMHRSRIIRGHLSEWIAMNAVAKASTNFDPSQDKRALQELIELRKADVKEYSELFESLQDEIKQLQSQIDELDAKSATERNESAKYELQMTSVSATKAAQLAERVREHTLRGDSYELESIRIQGRVGQLLPGAHEVELQVKKAMDQIELLELSIDELDQRVRDSKTDSAQARANAEAAKAKLSELVRELESYRTDTVIPASDKVISLIRQSLSASRNASSTAKASGAIAKASAQEHLARALAQQARGEAEMVSLYQSIISSGISGDWQSKLDSHTGAFNNLTEESKQAFQDAASALRSGRFRGVEGESIEAAAIRLDRLGGIEPEPEYSEESEYTDSEYDEEYDESMDDESFEDEYDDEDSDG